MQNNTISIVIGSWGSYTACNEKALGSGWLDLNDYSDWEEIEEELTKRGFKLNGIDEELFIQDIENLSGHTDWDYTHPKKLFELLKDSNVLDDEYAFDTMNAYIDVMGLDSFLDRVRDKGHRWDEDIYIYPDSNWYDLGYQFLHDSYGEKLDFIDNYIDYERYGEELKYDGFHEYDGGIIEIR